nr:MAG TPA: hypothetical protein [Caudoviricetes sp.]DAU33690.1 MAG TPA: hypothetical protein [Bacteriophage sp.]
MVDGWIFGCISRKPSNENKFWTFISKTLYFLGILGIIESENSGGAL